MLTKAEHDRLTKEMERWRAIEHYPSRGGWGLGSGNIPMPMWVKCLIALQLVGFVGGLVFLVVARILH